jgi:Domain of unknown function (DUF4304)
MLSEVLQLTWSPPDPRRIHGSLLTRLLPSTLQFVHMTQTKHLREVVKKRLHPFAERQGFTRAKSTNSLFTTFRRHGPTTTQVFDIQWDKYHEPRFVLNFGEAPAEGVDWGGTFISAATIEPYHCRERGRLQRRMGGSVRCWFQLRKPFWEALRSDSASYSPDELVDQVTAAFAELEDWWSSKRIGPHVYIPR